MATPLGVRHHNRLLNSATLNMNSRLLYHFHFVGAAHFAEISGDGGADSTPDPAWNANQHLLNDGGNEK